MRMSPSSSKDSEVSSPSTASYRGLPRGIWVLGFASMFMDISSELVHSLLPILMTTVLGASVLTVGVIEGVAEATASVSKVFSGVISDYFRKRKWLIVLGYGLSALTKAVFPLASSIGWVFSARFVDRIGKGVRDAPRDALIADIVPPSQRGMAYGLRQSLDSVGAFVGPLLAVIFMAWLADNIKAVLWIAVAPAFVAVMLLVFAIREPAHAPSAVDTRARLKLTDIKRLSFAYWFVVALGAGFTLARFSEAFLVLRAQDVGLALGYIPLVMVAMSVVYAACAYPAGVAADRLSARALLILGLGVLIVADGLLATSAKPVQVFVGAAFWGLHMALTQGLLSKLVADAAPAHLRGTAFGIFNLTTGVSLLLASTIAGALWRLFGPAVTFIAGAAFAALAILGLLFYRSVERRTAPRIHG